MNQGDLIMQKLLKYGTELSVSIGMMLLNTVFLLAADAGCNLPGGVVVDFSVDPLIDNHKSSVYVTLSGGSSDNYTFSLSAEPVVKNNIINKKGTSITFTKTGDLQWETSEVYWYGVSPDKACYDDYHKYKFTLVVTDSNGNTCTKTLTEIVDWPDEDPKMVRDLLAESESIVNDAEAVPGIANWYRALIEFADFNKSYSFEDLPSTDQYHEETTIEEEFHADQWMGAVSLDQGGSGDCFTAKGIKWELNLVGSGPWYFYGETAAEAEELAERQLSIGEQLEMLVSWDIVAKDRNFRELKAKEEANYNAAWTYECTYKVPNPQNHSHPAYE